MKNSKHLLGFVLMVLFIYLGFYLIQKEDLLSITIGYANIIFWGGLLLLSLYKIITKKTKI